MTTAVSDSPAVIFQKWLIDAALGVDPETDDNTNDWPVFIGILPDSDDVKDDAVAVFDTQGLKDGRVMAGETIIHHAVQFIVRGFLYDTGYTKIAAIRDALDAIKNVDVSVGANNYTIKQVSHAGIISLGVEQEIRRRARFTLNGISTISEN